MNVYEIVNQKIVEMLEKGTVPWKKPWNAESGMPKNLVSKKEYRGVNTFLLGCQEYGSPYWLSFKQCQEKGGHVRKGEKSTIVVFWKWLDRVGDGEPDVADEPRNGKIPLLRYYNIFNLEQTEGIEAPHSQGTPGGLTDPARRSSRRLRAVHRAGPHRGPTAGGCKGKAEESRQEPATAPGGLFPDTGDR